METTANRDEVRKRFYQLVSTIPPDTAEISETIDSWPSEYGGEECITLSIFPRVPDKSRLIISISEHMCSLVFGAYGEIKWGHDDAYQDVVDPDEIELVMTAVMSGLVRDTLWTRNSKVFKASSCIRIRDKENCYSEIYGLLDPLLALVLKDATRQDIQYKSYFA